MKKNEIEMAKDIFFLTEETTHELLNVVKDNNSIDQTLIYCYIKAFYMQAFKLYSYNKKMEIDFDNIYNMYKIELKEYYKENNPQITDEIIDDVLNFFDNSFGLINSAEINNVNDTYEFRHYIVNVFELLRMILEKKSKSIIRENIFDNYTRVIVNESDKIFDYIIKNVKK